MKPANTSRSHKDPAEPRRGKTTQTRMEKHEPRLPHERDQSADSQGGPDREKMQQAQEDLGRGLVDTDKGPEMDRVYRRNLRSTKG